MHSQQLLQHASLGGTSLTCKLKQSLPKAGTTAVHQRTRAVRVAAEKVKVTGATVKSTRTSQKAQPGSGSSSSSSGVLSAFNKLYSPLNGLVGTPIYFGLQLVELVITVGIVDAAYSGDWSRIGAISKETELQLQQVVWVLLGVKALCGVAAAFVAKEAGRGWVAPLAKGILFGSLALYEQTAPAAVESE
uniref:DUF7887 domain-containing protein n=1 Tax=Tetradesmus obliquus TaxID=3088 RepID=A0A383V7M4_TETOB|eukprot:jgi/Sobl393_1/13731/SZX61161.1